MYHSIASNNSGARAKKKNQPSQFAQATFDAFEPFINVFDCGVNVGDGPFHVITKEDWKLYRRHKAGERPYHSEGRRFHPYLDVVRNIYGPDHVHRHIEKNEVTYYTSGRNGLGLLYLDIDAHHPWQTDELRARELLEKLFPFGYFRASGRGQNGYLKIRYSSIAEFNQTADSLEETLKQLFLHCGILCDIEVKGKITNDGKSGSLAKLPFNTRYGPDLVHQTDWHWWQLELLDETDDWCCVRLEEFKAKPIVNLPRVHQIAQRVEEQIDEDKVSRFRDHRNAVKQECDRKKEQRCRLLELRKNKARHRISDAPSQPSKRVVANRRVGDTPVRPQLKTTTVISKKSPSMPVAPPSEQGRCEGNAFVRNQKDLLPFVREFFKRHRQFPDVEDALIHLRDNGLFSGQWEDNRTHRAKRVGQILRFIEKTFDPKELSNGESEPLELGLGKFSWWVRQKFGSGIRVKTADVRRFDPVSMTGPVVESFVPARFIETFLVVVDFCLNQDPLDNKAVPTNRIKTLWSMVAGGASWNQRYFQIVRDTLEQAGVIRIIDRNHQTGKAWRWDSEEFPADSWKEEQRRFKEKHQPPKGMALTFEELAGTKVVLNNKVHNTLYEDSSLLMDFSVQNFPARPPPI